MIRAVLLTNIPAPYRLEFFRELSALCDLLVLFDSKTEPNRQWAVPDDLGFSHAYLPGFAIRHTRRRRDRGPSDERYWQIRFGTLPALARFRPSVVISIEFGPRTLQAAAYCAARHLPLIIWSEGTPHTEGWQSALRQMVRRMLVKRAAAFWTNGVESSQLLESYGANKSSLVPGMIGVSTIQLADEVQRQLSHRDTARAELGVAGVVFLFSGQLVPRKGIREFLAALEQVANRAREFSVVFLGDGAQKAMLEEWVAAHPAVRTVILGFRQPEQLPQIYAAVDVFVMPTLDDNWSLVALEAAVAGLPQIFSRYNGATRDLMDMQAAGRVVDPFDARSFSDALREFLDHPPSRAAREITSSMIDYYSPKSCAVRAVESLRAVLSAAASMGGVRSI